ncbi:tyrosine-type recombinase/integrase, partial [Acinetobacter sp. 163]|nr:tyrosine-type recombinase/integrase [Acinetobacter sp. 163]
MKSIKTGIHQRIPVYLLFDGKGLDLIERYTDISHLTRIGCNADVNRTLKDICQVIGIEKRITWHTARHTFATQLLAQSVPITTIQKLLGHTSVKTTQIYSEVLDNTLIIDLKKTAKRSKSRTGV